MAITEKFLLNRRHTQTSADINFTFSLADLAKEKQHALRAKKTNQWLP
jgi:hypothetical protein